MHPRLRLLASFVLCVAALSTQAAFAGVPSASLSSVQAQLLLCPHEAIPFTVVVRDAASNPVASSTVQLSFASCVADPAYPGTPTHLCPTSGPLTVLSGIDGRATFQLKAGGVCPGSQARVFADGVLLAVRTVASPDQDGSLVVIGGDSALLVAKENAGVYDATADLDGDGDTSNDAGDYAVYDAHAGHGCDAVTPALPGTWGSLKIRYH